MFKTFVGPVEGTASVAWLRPETAQSIFVNFDNVQQASRKRIPFGIAQIGKAFRNEITPGNFIFRSREFEQMEMQYFTRPEDAPRFFEEWKARRREWHESLGMPADRIHRHARKYGEQGIEYHQALAAFPAVGRAVGLQMTGPMRMPRESIPQHGVGSDAEIQ